MKIKEFLNNELKGRSGTPDLIKGIAVIKMILVHILELFLLLSAFNSVLESKFLFFSGSTGPTVFMIVMGYFIAKSSKDISEGFTRGFLLIGGGILLNILLNASLLYHFFTRQSEINPFHYIFAVDILIFAGISLLIIYAVKKVSNNNLYAFVILFLIVAVISEIAPRDINPENTLLRYLGAVMISKEDWSYFPLFPWLIYPLTGYIFALTEAKLKPKAGQAKWIIAVFIIFTALTVTKIFSDVYTLSDYYHHGINIILWNIIFLAGYVTTLSLAEEKAGNNIILLGIKWIGKNVTAAYVIQWIVIGNIGTWIYRTQTAESIFLWFPAILLVVVAGIIFWNRYKSKLIK